jgi:CBS domain-containing protein
LRVGKLSNMELVTAEVTDTLLEAATKMDRQHVGALPVLDDGELVGVLSERDLVKAMAEGAAPDTTSVVDYMTEGAITVRLQDEVSTATRRMREHGIRHLPVVLSGQVVGMLSIRDLIEPAAGEG